MRTWPLSMLVASPYMPLHLLPEIDLARIHGMSMHCADACIGVMQRTQAVNTPNLIVVETIGAHARRMFLNHPTHEEWHRLERICGHATEERSFILIDALH